MAGPLPEGFEPETPEGFEPDPLPVARAPRRSMSTSVLTGRSQGEPGVPGRAGPGSGLLVSEPRPPRRWKSPFLGTVYTEPDPVATADAKRLGLSDPWEKPSFLESIGIGADPFGLVGKAYGSVRAGIRTLAGGGTLKSYLDDYDDKAAVVDEGRELGAEAHPVGTFLGNMIGAKGATKAAPILAPFKPMEKLGIGGRLLANAGNRGVWTGVDAAINSKAPGLTGKLKDVGKAELGTALPGLLLDSAGEIGGAMSRGMDRSADRLTVRALRGNKPDVSKMLRTGDRPIPGEASPPPTKVELRNLEGVGREIRDRNLMGWTTQPDVMAARLGAAADKVGAEIPASVAAADSEMASRFNAGHPVLTPDTPLALSKAGRSLDQSLGGDFASAAVNKGAIGNAKATLADIANGAVAEGKGSTHADMYTARRGLDQAVGSGWDHDSVRNSNIGALKRARGNFDTELRDIMGFNAPEAAAKFDQGNLSYRRLLAGQQAAETGAQRAATNQMFGLKGSLAGAGAAGAGAVFGALHGGAGEAGIGAVAGPLAAMTVQKLIHMYGPQVGAKLAGRAAAMLSAAPAAGRAAALGYAADAPGRRKLEAWMEGR